MDSDAQTDLQRDTIFECLIEIVETGPHSLDAIQILRSEVDCLPNLLDKDRSDLLRSLIEIELDSCAQGKSCRARQLLFAKNTGLGIEEQCLNYLTSRLLGSRSSSR